MADGVFEAACFEGGGIDYHGAAIGGEVAGEIAALQDRPADGGPEFRVDIYIVEINSFFLFGLAFPLKRVAVVERGGRQGRFGDIGDHAGSQQLVAEGVFLMPQGIGVDGDGDESIAVIADGAVFCDLYLAEDDDSSDDERERDRELECHQYPPGQGRGLAGAENAFQNPYGFEGREIECRVATGEEAGE